MFDMKRAGTETTNGNGINMLENYSVVSDELMKVFSRSDRDLRIIVGKDANMTALR